MGRRCYPERKPDPNRVRGGNLRVKYPGEPLPTVAQCKAKIQEGNWRFSHKDITGRYIFEPKERTPAHSEPKAFTLRELREAYHHGW